MEWPRPVREWGRAPPLSCSERKFRLAGLIGSWILRLLGATLRFRRLGDDLTAPFRSAGKPHIYVIWHAWMLPLIYLHRGQGIVVLASEHGDGEYISRIVERLGFGTSRGSSSRGGERGLRGILRSLRDHRAVAITPDGPRGPARRLKDGVLVAAQLSGAPIVAIRARTSSAWRLSSWDRFVIPKPLSRVEVEYGGPWWVARDAGKEELGSVAADIEDFLNGFDEEP